MILWVFLDHWNYLEWQVDVLSNAVSHQIKDSIRRNEGNRTVTVKFTKSDTLVELNVIYLNTSVLLARVSR